MSYTEIIAQLESLSNPDAVAGMARFGINSENARGISIPDLRRLARQTGRDHALAEQLWASGIHEARILASMIDKPALVSEAQMERWVADFNSWDLCDQCCSNLFDKTAWAYQKAMEWSQRNEEFIKRAGFVMMAVLAVHDKGAGDDRFETFFDRIQREATDDRNFVKKAVNWALRQIGKRNRRLNKRAIEVAAEIRDCDVKAAHWIGADAMRELTSRAVQERLRR